MKAKKRKKIRKYVILGTLAFLTGVEIAIFAKYGWGVARL